MDYMNLVFRSPSKAVKLIHSFVLPVDPVLSGKARNVACGPLK